MRLVKHAPRLARAAGPAPRHCLGAHLSIAGGVHNALAAALRLGCDTVQLFVKNQRQWRATPLSDDELRRWHTLRATPALGPPVAHASYLINLASADRRLQLRSREALAQELRRCQLLDIPYLVLHPGAAGEPSRQRGLQRVAKAIDAVFEQNPKLRTMLLLETTAGQGSALGRSLAELGQIIRLVAEPQRIGVCLDTCHLFAAGYDLRRREGYGAMTAELAGAVGLTRVRCWHLNDSKGRCGSRVDRHEHIGRGQLGLAAFRNVLLDPRFLGMPMIIETPKGTDAAGRNWDQVNLRRLRAIAARAARGRTIKSR